ncbi:MAG: hypothetical protein KME17_27280 [Cyanosarcina radialis HA8281-LM2]|jgi:hypothetical protein|nr:hypothetical protein [Cyanosarcina radialis HA8281-LM2]
MKTVRSSLIIIGSVGSILLSACNSGTQTSSPPANSSPAARTAPAANKDEPGKPQKGGQVVESGSYHLEFVTEKGDRGTHLDLYLQTGANHEAIPNAKVTAQVRSPDGTQQNLNFAYDAKDEHYAALFTGRSTGQHQVKITADLNGEKINGRFSFNQ